MCWWRHERFQHCSGGQPSASPVQHCPPSAPHMIYISAHADFTQYSGPLLKKSVLEQNSDLLLLWNSLLLAWRNRCTQVMTVLLKVQETTA